LIILVSFVFVMRVCRKKESYYALEEIIPEGRIISQEEGVIEYKGAQFILGTHDLKQRKGLIEKLKLLDLEGPCVIDMRFDTQVIIRKGSDLKQRSDPDRVQ
jgi:hypothetical protein